MLAAIVRFSLRFRGVIIALACLFLAYGIYALSRAKYDVFPEFAPPQVGIQTEAPGLSPEQVEVLVTQPIENEINGVPGIESMRSGSVQGLSVITVTFAAGSDIYRNRQVVAERLSALAGRLPQGVNAPAMSPLTSSTSTVLVVGLTSDKRSLMDLRTLADWTVKPRLLAVPGVAKVVVFGGEVKQFQIQIEADQLIRHRLSVQDVLAAAGGATGVRGAGFIDGKNQRVTLQVQGQSLTPAQIARTVVLQKGGANVTLGDVATVVEAAEPPVGAATVMGRPGLQIVISSQYGANTLEVTGNVERAVEDLRPALTAEGVTLHPDLFRPANFVRTATANVGASLAIGGVLVVVVLILFLFNLRTAAISLTAIPLSLVAAVTLLETLGLSLNTMTLGGLAISIGLLVDDAVIAVENIYRRLRENHHLTTPRPAFDVVLGAVLEVRSAVVYATLVVALVFVPVLTLPGIAGRLFAPLGIAYILATLASRVVALTLTPALALLLLRRGKGPEQEPPLYRWLKPRYGALLERVERRPRAILAVTGTFTLAGLAVLPFLGGSFLPELKEGHFIVHMAAVPGTSIDESLRMGNQVSAALEKLSFVRSVGQRVGRAELADDTSGTHYSEFEVDLKALDGEEAELATAEMRKTLAQFPGVNFAVKTFLTERIEETLSGYRYSVVVNIYGNDLDILDRKAKEIAKTLGQVPGAADVQIQSPPGSPQLVVHLREADVARWGFAPVEVMDAVETAYQGRTVGQTYDGNRIFAVSVILSPRDRTQILDVGNLPLRNRAGTYVRLRQLADIYEASGRYVVLHEGARRVQTVAANVAGRDLNSFVAQARELVKSQVSLPGGMYVQFVGAAEAQAQARRDLLVHASITGMGIVLVLALVIGQARNLLLVLLNLPFALVGGVLVLFATGGGLSMGSLVGFVTLFGITLRNSIMMIAHYEQLVSVEGLQWGPEAAIRGAQERLAPILMTALVTAFGLVPLALGSNQPGREIEGPMALVILGGLATSTALNLLILPALALRFGRFGATPDPVEAETSDA